VSFLLFLPLCLIVHEYYFPCHLSVFSLNFTIVFRHVLLLNLQSQPTHPYTINTRPYYSPVVILVKNRPGDEASISHNADLTWIWTDTRQQTEGKHWENSYKPFVLIKELVGLDSSLLWWGIKITLVDSWSIPCSYLVMHVYQEMTYFEPRLLKSVTHQNQAQKVDISYQIRHCFYNTDSTAADHNMAGWTPDAVAATHKANDASASIVYSIGLFYLLLVHLLLRKS